MVINKARPISLLTVGGQTGSNIQKVREGEVKRAVIVRTKAPVQRPDGSMIRFDDNACVLLNAKGDMIGTRVNGVVAAELAKAQGSTGASRWAKILSLAGKVSDGFFFANVTTPS